MPNPFCHVELLAEDVDVAKTFYKELFDWEMSDVPMGDGTYTVFKAGDSPGGAGGGIMKNPVPGVPTHWLVYVLVDNVAASTEKAESLGGTVHQRCVEIPNMGAFSVIQDPQGAVIGMWEHRGTH